MRVCIEIPLSRVSDLLCCALEGGSNYWYTIEERIKPTSLDFRTGKNRIYEHLDYPLNPGGALLIKSTEEPEKPAARLDLQSIERGLTLMAQTSHHWGDFIAENEDATTGDVFLQFCLFGEVIYS